MALMEEEQPGRFTWSLVDTSTDEGLTRLRALRQGAGRRIPVPSITADGVVIFDALPDLEDLDDWMSANLPAASDAARSDAPPEHMSSPDTSSDAARSNAPPNRKDPAS